MARRSSATYHEQRHRLEDVCRDRRKSFTRSTSVTKVGEFFLCHASEPLSSLFVEVVRTRSRNDEIGKPAFLTIQARNLAVRHLFALRTSVRR